VRGDVQFGSLVHLGSADMDLALRGLDDRAAAGARLVGLCSGEVFIELPEDVESLCSHTI
jgi:hypothetical protein